jgi:SAM-dependent methyltransferase
VSAIETIYYWPNPVKDLREVLRVLKTGGQVIVLCETYKGGRWDFLKGPTMKLLRSKNFSVNEYKELFASAGYTDVQVVTESSRGWVCAIGKRPVKFSDEREV